MYRVVMAAVALVLLMAACSDDVGDPDQTGASPADAPKEDVMDEAGPLAQAIADLANKADADPADIEVVANDQVTWRDGSLGCPEPGMMYTQALVDGYRIVLRVSGTDFFYHGQLAKPPFRCDDPDPKGAVITRPDR